jgi:glutamate-ammonia-ligase adenylyltransferase
MRALMRSERPAAGFWDMKLSDGGLVDIEFAAQFLQLVNACKLKELHQHTGLALAALAEARLAPRRALRSLEAAWRLQQGLGQLLKVALDDDADPDSEPVAFQRMLAKAGQSSDFDRLRGKLARSRSAAHAAFQRLVR